MVADEPEEVPASKPSSSCVAEESVLEIGNQILTVLGAEDPIDDVATFTADSLYLQLFEVIFPNYDFAEVEPGQTAEEMASNIQGLLDLLGGQVLDMDLSFISAEKIVEGDL